MQKQDWLQREINRLAQVLAKLLGLKLSGQPADVLQLAIEECEGLDIGDAPPEVAVGRILEKVGSPAQAETLSQIFREKGWAEAQLGHLDAAQKSYTIALLLLEWVDGQEAVFSFERQEEFAFLRQQLSKW